jgi:hypothetical protein
MGSPRVGNPFRFAAGLQKVACGALLRVGNPFRFAPGVAD